MNPKSKLLTATVLLSALGGCAQKPDEATVANSPTPVVFNPTDAPTVEFNLPDMMCEDGCAMAVKDILQRQGGVKDVHVDFEAKTATVAVDEKAFDADQALADLVDKGFEKSTLAGDGTDAAATTDAAIDRAPEPADESTAQPSADASSPSS